MADGAHTRQMSLQDMVQQLKEMNAQQAELKGEIGDMFGDMFSEMKADLLGILKQALKLPEQTTVTNPNPSVETVTNPEPLVETLKNSGPFIEPLRRASVLQVPDSFCDVLLVHKLDSHVKEVEEFSHESTNGNDKIVAHQLFDQMPNEYQKDLTVISNKEVLSFSHKDARVWEPGGLSNKMDHWNCLRIDGTLLREWFRCCDEYFDLHKTPPEMRVRVASPHMIASHVRQFDVTTVADAGWIAKHCESSLLQHSSSTQNRAPFSPYQNSNDQCHYKREFDNLLDLRLSLIESEEIEDDELQDKQPEEDVETLVISENEQPLECVDDESSVDEKFIEVIAEETALEPVDESGCNFYKERNLNSLLCQSLRLLHFEEFSDTTVPCLNLETKALSSLFSVGGIMLLSDSRPQSLLGPYADLPCSRHISSDTVCGFLQPLLIVAINSRMIFVSSGIIFVDDIVATLRNTLEDKSVLRMEEVCIEGIKHNLEFVIDRGWVEYWINTHVFTLTNSGLRLSSSEYTKNTLILVYLLCTLSSSRLFVKTYAGCIVALLMVSDAERLIQSVSPLIFIIIEALTLFKGQHTLVAEKNGTETSIVLKLIFGTSQNDVDEAVRYVRHIVKVFSTESQFNFQRSHEHHIYVTMLKQWVLQVVSQQRKQGTEKLWVLNEPMIGTSFSLMKNIESPKEHEQLEDAARGIRSYESNIGQVEKSLIEFSVYGVFHLQRPPELGQTKQYGQELYQVFCLSSLRTRMFRRGKYCDRRSLNKSLYSINLYFGLCGTIKLLVLCWFYLLVLYNQYYL